MSVPIALYATPTSSVCSHATFDFELSSRSLSYLVSTSYTSQKPAMGGLLCLFSSSGVKHAMSSSSFSGEELGSMWDRGEELKDLSSSFRYSQRKFNGHSITDQSPISMFQGPVSSSSSGVSGSARSPPLRIGRERSIGGDGSLNLKRCGSNGLFNGFMRGALGSSCVDYDSASFEVRNDGLEMRSSGVVLDELTFNMEDGCEDGNCEPYVRDLLVGAQLWPKIFYEDFVIKAFYEAEKAHRGQMRASGDPYLQHCVETVVVLALIGANSTVVAAGLLHDTLDDSVMSYDYIYEKSGA